MIEELEETDASLINRAGVPQSLELSPSTESAWIQVIHKMDAVYADLVRYQVELEHKNSPLEEAQRFLGSVLSAMTDVLIVCDTEGRIQQVNAALDAWAAKAPPHSSDFRHFLHIARALNLQDLGRGADRFMSYGAYPCQGARFFTPGIWCGSAGELDQTRIREDISHSWLHHQSEPKHPFDGLTLPSVDERDAYTWCKAPRLDGQVMEVGALARQLVNGHPPIRDLVAQSGGNVRNRVIARLLEIVVLLMTVLM